MTTLVEVCPICPSFASKDTPFPFASKDAPFLPSLTSAFNPTLDFDPLFYDYLSFVSLVSPLFSSFLKLIPAISISLSGELLGCPSIASFVNFPLPVSFVYVRSFILTARSPFLYCLTFFSYLKTVKAENSYRSPVGSPYLQRLVRRY